jgi:putative acetyltransferase
MSVAEAEAWAATLSVDGMEQKIRELEIWVAEVSNEVAGWGAISGNQLKGLYTDPKFAGRGIGKELLGSLEALMRGRGISVVCAEASSNAEKFYLRCGYEPAGLGTPDGTHPIIKRLG